MDDAAAYFLRTERLGFRSWRSDDLDLALELWGDPEVTRWIARDPLTRDDVAERLDREIDLEFDHGLQYWPMFLLDGDVFVGCCGLRPRHEAAGIMELGFHLCARHWGHGYAKEAARAMIGFAFDTVGASALFAGHHPENHRSRRLLETLGFRHTHDEPYAPTGLDHPSYLLAKPTA